jgi:hypothetical protein
MKRLAK